MAMDLPDELWQQIFDLAADEDVIFSYGLPTNMAECAWYKNAFGEWALRTPQEAINLVQRRSYATKKAIMKTCTTWRRVGSETFFRCLFFSDPGKLYLLSQHLKSFSNPSLSSPASSPGWWTRRLHLARYNASPNKDPHLTEEELSSSLTTILSHTPNLQILVIEHPLSTSTFSSFAPYLRTRSSTRPPSSFSPQTSPGHPLHTLSLHLSFESLPKLIWALDSLPNLVSLHVTFDSPSADTLEVEELKLGSAGGLELNLGQLQQLSLKGACGVFLDEASGWGMPNLRGLQVDLGSMRNPNLATNGSVAAAASGSNSFSDAGAYPDLVAFLEAPLPSANDEDDESSENTQTHGLKLLYLDINSIPPMDVPRILDACPRLETFCFNGDWKMDPVPTHLGGTGVSSITSLALGRDSTPPTRLTVSPHPSIRTVGLHGLSYAFGVGYAAAYAEVEPLRASRVCRSNDANFVALGGSAGTGRQFPELKNVRVLSRGLLRDLERAGGPSAGSGSSSDKGKQRESTPIANTTVSATSSALDALGLSGLGLDGFQFEYGLGGSFGSPSRGNTSGPPGGTGMQRWERWYDQCSRLGIRLEDCTGSELGELPDPGEAYSDVSDSESEENVGEEGAEGSWGEGSEEEESEEESEYESEEDPDEWPSWLPRPPPLPVTPTQSAPPSPTKSVKSLSPSKRAIALALGSGPRSQTSSSVFGSGSGGGLGVGSTGGGPRSQPGSPTKKPSPLNPNATGSRPTSPTKANTSAPVPPPAVSSSSWSTSDQKENSFQPTGSKLSKTNTRELRKLIEECKAMSEGRDEEGLPFLPGMGLPGMGGPFGGGMGMGMPPFPAMGGFSRNSFGGGRRSMGEDLDLAALGALAGLPPIGPPPDSPTKESSGAFGISSGGSGFGFGQAGGPFGGRESPTRRAIRELDVRSGRGRESLGFGIGTDTRFGARSGTDRRTHAPKPVFGVSGGLDMLGRGTGEHRYRFSGENEDEGEVDEEEYESSDGDEDNEEAEVEQMLGDLSVR